MSFASMTKPDDKIKKEKTVHQMWLALRRNVKEDQGAGVSEAGVLEERPDKSLKEGV